MSHFMKRMETSLGHLSFYFNRIFTAEGLRYHVSVRVRGEALAFNMHLVDTKWELVNSTNCPEWLNEMQPKLSETIIEFMGL
ncbi:MAG: hypothetical protein ACXWCZ_04525 [Flavisolibacter sp.]